MRPGNENESNGTPLTEQPLTITARELAVLLAVSERHVWGMLKSGRLGPQPMRFDRAVRWDRAEIGAWIAAGAPSRETWMANRDGAAPTILPPSSHTQKKVKKSRNEVARSQDAGTLFEL